MSEFPNRFRQLKEESGMTLKELSAVLGITVPNLSYYMNGREPNYDTLIKFANYFNVTTDYLVRNDTQENILEKEMIDLRLGNKKLLMKIDEIKQHMLKFMENI